MSNNISIADYQQVPSHIFTSGLFMERYVHGGPSPEGWKTTFTLVVTDDDGQTLTLKSDFAGNIVDCQTTFTKEQTYWLKSTFSHHLAECHIDDLAQLAADLNDQLHNGETGNLSREPDPVLGLMTFCADVEELWNHQDKLYMIL